MIDVGVAGHEDHIDRVPPRAATSAGVIGKNGLWLAKMASVGGHRSSLYATAGGLSGRKCEGAKRERLREPVGADTSLRSACDDYNVAR